MQGTPTLLLVDRMGRLRRQRFGMLDDLRLGAEIATLGDHRIAMAFAIAALTAEGETRIQDAECADVSFPGFWNALRKICGSAY